MPVVHDLLADVDGRTVLVECTLDGLHGAIHAGAISPRFGEQDALGFSHVPKGTCWTTRREMAE